jgi:hypothetical protein
MALVLSQRNASEDFYGDDRDRDPLEASEEERYRRRHPPRPHAYYTFVYGPGHDPIAERAGTLPHEWFVRHRGRMTDRMIRKACADATEWGAFALRVLVSNDEERRRWRRNGFVAAETGLTPNGRVCVPSVWDKRYAMIGGVRRERLVCVLHPPEDGPPPGQGRAEEEDDEEEYDDDNNNPDDDAEVVGVLSWRPKPSAALLYNVMFGASLCPRRWSLPYHSMPPSVDSVGFRLFPWSTEGLNNIRAASSDICKLSRSFVLRSVSKADLVLFASDPQTGEIQSVVTVFSDIKGKCLPHEWYVDIACSVKRTRSVVALFEILKVMARANGIQALRLHSIDEALSYWTPVRMFREAETIRDTAGRCLYSVRVAESEPADRGLTRLVLIISESPPPPPRGMIRECVIRRRTPLQPPSSSPQYEIASSDRGSDISTVAPTDDAPPVILLPYHANQGS